MPSNVLGRIALRLGMMALAVNLAGCATPPPDDDPEAKAEFERVNDPFEPANRAIFAFNDNLDTYFLRPVAQGYRTVVPPFGRDRVADFLGNLASPLVFTNDLLQGNLKLAGITVERFALNTTFGVFGIMDVADRMGLPAHDSDFGETFGVWGVGEGPYIVLPLYGPSNPRDALGRGVEWFADPVDLYFDDNAMHWASYTRFGAETISQREALLDVLDDVKRTSLDYYSALRSLYRQRRSALINGAKHPDRYIAPPSDKHSD